MSTLPVILQVANCIDRAGNSCCWVTVSVDADSVSNDIIMAVRNNFLVNSYSLKDNVYAAWRETAHSNVLELAEQIGRAIRAAGYGVILFNPKGYTFKED